MMNIEKLNLKNISIKTFITHFSIWFLYLLLQLWWRFDSYGIYTLIAAFLQVLSWAVIFYIVRLYLFTKTEFIAAFQRKGERMRVVTVLPEVGRSKNLDKMVQSELDSAESPGVRLNNLGAQRILVKKH